MDLHLQLHPLPPCVFMAYAGTLPSPMLLGTLQSFINNDCIRDYRMYNQGTIVDAWDFSHLQSVPVPSGVHPVTY